MISKHNKITRHIGIMVSNSSTIFNALILVCGVFPLGLVDGFSCKNNNQQNVDWFIVYKLPILTDQPSGSLLRNGRGFCYLDANNPTWTLQNTAINDNNAISYTLGQMYAKNFQSNVEYMLYSDQEPDGGSSHTAHAKGALLFDSNEGFWMVHSLPRFPADPSMKYIWPENGYINGQVFLCVTYPRQELDTIKNQILFYKPNIYSRHPQPSGLSISSAAQSADGSTSPISLVTLKDRQFLSIAKQDGHDFDIYEYVAERLRVTGFDVQTWRNGGGTKLASCTGQTKHTFTGKYSVENIDTLQFPSPNGGTITYERTKDHSKWCVSDDRSRPWVCIGDLNRMVSQRTRGGGVVCLNNLAVWEQFRRLRGEIEVANIDRRDCPGVFSLHFVQYVFSYFSDPLRKHDVSRRSLDLPDYLRARN